MWKKKKGNRWPRLSTPHTSAHLCHPTFEPDVLYTWAPALDILYSVRSTVYEHIFPLTKWFSTVETGSNYTASHLWLELPELPVNWISVIILTGFCTFHTVFRFNTLDALRSTFSLTPIKNKVCHHDYGKRNCHWWHKMSHPWTHPRLQENYCTLFSCIHVLWFEWMADGSFLLNAR